MEQQLYESEIKSGGHGEKFQTDIALALSLRMRELSSTTRMAYEMKMADKFDDVVLIDDTNEEIHLIQAKHADTKDEQVKIVDLDALFPTGNSAKRNGDFDLCKYAKSYLSVTGRLEPREYKKMFYIFTNKDLKQTDNEWVKIEEREVNEILRFSGSSARNLELIPTEKAIDEMCDYINKDFIAIKDAIKEFFHSGTISQMFIHYCTPLKDVMIIDRKKCRFAGDFNAENTKPNVAMLYTMLQSDQVDMEKEVPANNNFLAKDSRNKLLPPFVGEDDIRDFFRDLTLSVGQPNDLRPIIVGELLAWMKTWIQPDILGQLGEKDLEQVYIDLEAYFANCNKPVNENRKRFLTKQDIEQCFGQIKREMQTGVIKRVMPEAEEWQITFINRHIKYEEVALEPTGKLLGKATDKDRTSTIARQISDIRFVEELRGRLKNQQHILLVADPGMGKTRLLQFLAFEVQKQNQSAVFLMYLRTLCNELNKIEQVSSLNDVRGILSAVLSENNCNLILNAPERRNDEGYSIILALDAFDEIHSKYTEKVISILELLSLKKSIQFIISSRLHVQELLQSKFDVKLIYLVPFQREDQIRYLKKIWVKKSVDEKVVENFSELLLKKYHSSILSNFSEISGLPLMMRMLAEIYSNKFEQFSSAGNFDNMRSFDWSEDILNIVQLLEHFVSKCFHNKIVAKFKCTVDINDAEFNSIIDVYILEHQLLAIRLLDIEMLMDLFTKPDYKKKYDTFKSRCEQDAEKSILVKVVNNDVQFCHLLFGEYFVATYLSDHISELKPNLLINVLSQRDFIRKLTLIKLGEEENCSETLNDLCRLNWNVALWACESGCLKLVSSLKVESFSSHQLNNMLNVSAKCGYFEICNFLIGYNANLDKCTALHSAVENGHVSVVQLLLKCKVDPNNRRYYGETPLHIAALNGHASVVKLLVENNADLNELDEDGRTALHYASRKGNVETVQLLIDRGMNTSSRSIHDVTPLHIAAENGHPSVVKLLIENNSDPYAMDSKNWGSLHYASRNENVETVKFLINQGFNTNCQTFIGQTALHIAALDGHVSVVKQLIANNADPNRMDNYQWTALHFACYNGNAEMVKFLIDQARKGHTSAVKLLVRNNSDPYEMDDYDWTALHHASHKGNVETVQFFADQGVNQETSGIIAHFCTAFNRMFLWAKLTDEHSFLFIFFFLDLFSVNLHFHTEYLCYPHQEGSSHSWTLPIDPSTHEPGTNGFTSLPNHIMFPDCLFILYIFVILILLYFFIYVDFTELWISPLEMNCSIRNKLYTLIKYHEYQLQEWILCMFFCKQCNDGSCFGL
ncbi:uncharacterized protein LOC135707469 isoform X2 [Ochlerotatus camptorhynchus]|uniref:uncharacterized protein LOC135707469 isoform X2 n=1 Tax=Ochlerotatus camptorhynchus TaxID=644619 RepID=UPI0031E0214D